jgi:hypothetical protein
MDHYTTTTGEVIALETHAPGIVAFLRRAVAAAHDPSVSADELSAFIFGLENPLLDQSILPGRGVVTKALRESPLYVMLMDLLSVKSASTTASLDDEEDAREATRQRARALPLATPTVEASLPPSAGKSLK